MTPENLAYLIYTSGSTGQPKGTLIAHRSLVNYLSWAVQRYEVAQGEGAPLHSSISFDATITSLFAPLITGRRLTILPEGGQEIDHIRAALQPLLSGRGCPYKCNFCYRLDEGFRPRSSESIIEEIRILKKDYGITYIAFMDELLMSSEARVRTLCEDFIKAGLDIKWECCGRLNFAKPDILALMKQSGCVFINYGIEAMDDQVLKNMNKALTTRQVVSGIEATLAAGISPGFNIIFVALPGFHTVVEG